MWHCLSQMCICDIQHKVDMNNTIKLSRSTSFQSSSDSSMSIDDSIYHNTKHIKEVVHFAKQIIIITGCSNAKQILYACQLHDACHPVTKSKVDFIFQKKKYSRTNLEEFHADIASDILKRASTLNNVSIEIIKLLIMATNLQTYNDIDLIEDIALMKCIIRCADLCHFTYNLDEHITHYNFLNSIDIIHTPASNIIFIDKFVIPTFEKLYIFNPNKEFLKYLIQIKINKQYWIKQTVKCTLPYNFIYYKQPGGIARCLGK